jgi:hypothetical protein
MQQAEVIQNLENEHVRNKGKAKSDVKNIRGLKLGGCRAYNRSSD